MSSKDYIYCYQGSALRVGSGNVVVGKVFDPYDPSTLEPFTIRCRFSPGYTPTMGNKQTLVVESENIWDITKNHTNWTFLLTSNSSLIEILCANSNGVTDMTAICSGCSNLVSVRNFYIDTCTSMGQAFSSCPSLVSVSLYNTIQCNNMRMMFSEDRNLTNVNLFDTSSCTNMKYMFMRCESISSVPLFDTSSCNNMERMFYSCSSLTSVPLFDTSSCNNMESMFAGCDNVESGAFALYQHASTQATIPSHSSTFEYCGRHTVTGAAELAQIPRSWGGTMAE